MFTIDELVTIDSLLDDVAGMTATQVNTLSDEEAAWRHTVNGDRIPYEPALVPREQVVTPTTGRLGAEVDRRSARRHRLTRIHEVRVASVVLEEAHERDGKERSASGAPTEHDQEVPPGTDHSCI